MTTDIARDDCGQSARQKFPSGGAFGSGKYSGRAIAAAIPYIVALGKEAAKGAAGAAGKSVWEWVKGKLTSAAGTEAVTDLENAPHDAVNRTAAEAALSKLLRADPGALSELAQLLDKAGITSTVLTANVIGNENIVGQVSGSGTVSINRGPTPPVKPSKAS